MSLTFEPDPPMEGTTVAGEVTLYCPATTANVGVTLFATDGWEDMPPTVTIPIGQSSASFSVSIDHSSSRKIRFLAAANGGVVTDTITVKRP